MKHCLDVLKDLSRTNADAGSQLMHGMEGNFCPQVAWECKCSKLQHKTEKETLVNIIC